MSTDLDTLLSGSAAEAPIHAEPSPAPQAETQPPSEPTGDTTNSAAPPADAEPTAQSESLVPQRALQDERRKRQEYERKLAEMEARIAQLQPRQQQQPEPQPEADWYTNPQAAAQQMQMALRHEVIKSRFEISESVMSERYPDYVEIREVFTQAAQQNPALRQQLLEHPNPAKFAYDVGRQVREWNEFQTVRTNESEWSEFQAWKANKGQQQPAAAAPSQAPKPSAAAVPRSLARDVSQQPRNERGQFDGHASLDEILG
jgi:hypothetical protein